MSKDKRLFARLDLDYADHPKIMMLSDEAFRAHITFLLYARKYMTDGVINNRVANRVASQWDTDVLTELSTNDEASPSLVKLESGDWYLHGYEDMQETRAEIEARTARNKANGRKGGRPPSKNKTQSVAEPGAQSGAQNLTQTKAETETETETETYNPLSPPEGEKNELVDVEVIEEGSTSAKPFPSEFLITPKMKAWAEKNVPHLDLVSETREFVAYWKHGEGKGKKRKNWVMAWQNRMRQKYQWLPASERNAPRKVKKF